MSKTRTISYEHRIHLFWTFITISILSLSFYIYAINAAARHIAERQDLEKQIAEIETNLNSLEFAYIELKNNVTIELAYQYGFREARVPLYVSRTSPASLSFNTSDK
ncbi:MAG: hypothetical protein UT07_C0002G0002 [Parcubacteria group bacterium GW2011_GWB1_38_8]|uniref:Cell division protein FtsL n=1 Tax=Candidatus Zambryskibacteria bacterium RIFCSPLOWO2_02_FULL_39_14 TaxID=1802769 RepID=A0A1G2UIB9_9BACT|nr:MAG: hypothetical protein UT07_C0002G0002 [Parcubacteria group bacterium GW2011_GWB1_38_8]KKR30505.1 MAG: hypothetical protein UT62_C0011G0002 [Parcubacteria group bacterium GW2011_GWC1_39_8]OHA95433.1 MAG: hypothetical protein A3C62_02550 [Candidatus Zambryskibacteria bacterium RIFCSPHIGHO2_02_FULL_39_16]OHB09165.1 MAG: hypothetical protein A3I86_01825 [Candidatus Zambryskibacteria bacterium RIFCSPLOWO2_02_FULL_39_14]